MLRRTVLALPAAAFAAGAEIRIAYSGFVWQTQIEDAIRTIGRHGFHGIEPFRSHLLPYLGKPAALREQLDAAGIAMATCSNGGAGMQVNFIDPNKTSQTIEDHVLFVRDFLVHFGCKHLKINLGARPEGGPSKAQLDTMAAALNELGRRTAAIGVKLAPHPHIWSPLEREDEVRHILDHTDPEYVGLTADTAHLTLGGIDPLRLITDYYPRLTAMHWKDTDRQFRGHRGPTPTRESHRQRNLYRLLGSGGVDFKAIWSQLRRQGFSGWITMDFDPPRPDEGTIEEQLTSNKDYLEEEIGIRSLG